MASTYSTNLKIELIGTGEQAGTWGTTTNTNLGTALEQAVVGKADVTMSSTTITLTLTNANTAQNARAIYLNLTGSPGGAAVLEVPAIQKPYIVKNGSDQQVTIKVSGQTGVAIPTGKTALVYNNGTDVVTAVDFIPEIATTTVDTTNIEVTNIKAKDGTAAGSIADSTGVVTLASSVLTTTDINGGTIDGAVIGGASAAAGSFTSLNTSGAVVFNDAGADVDFRVEGDTEANLLFVDASTDRVGIGTNAPAQTLHVKTTMAGIYANGGTSTGLYYMTPTGNSHFFGIADVTKMTIDSSGNVGIGVTPSAWETVSGSTAIQFLGSSLYGYRDTNLILVQNAYFDGAFKYYASSIASGYYTIGSGVHSWYTAPSGTAGNAITFTQAMTLDASSRLLVGTTTLGLSGNSNVALSLANGNATIYQSIRASGGEELYLYASTGVVGLYSYSNTPLVFGTNNTERMRIQANGGLSFANTASPGPFNTVLGDRNNHFTGQRSNTVPSGTTSTMLTINFGLNGAAIVRVVDAGSVPGSDYFMNVYEYFVTCYAGVVTATLKQSQAGGGAGSFITTSTGSAEFNVIQTANASIATVHDTAVDVLTASSGNGAHDTTTITMAANN
jgi:hypothetical protein